MRQSLCRATDIIRRNNLLRISMRHHVDVKKSQNKKKLLIPRGFSLLVYSRLWQRKVALPLIFHLSRPARERESAALSVQGMRAPTDLLSVLQKTLSSSCRGALVEMGLLLGRWLVRYANVLSLFLPLSSLLSPSFERSIRAAHERQAGSP